LVENSEVMSGDVLSRYSAFSPYVALSHNISAHQSKTMLFICNNGDCNYQCVAEVDMVQHMKIEHSDQAPLVCSVTLVIKKSSGDGYVECPVLVKRTGTLEFVTSIRVKTNTAKAAVTAKRRIRDLSVSSSEEDDNKSEEEIAPKCHTLRRKGTKTQKAGKKEADRRETRQATARVAVTAKRRIRDLSVSSSKEDDNESKSHTLRRKGTKTKGAGGKKADRRETRQASKAKAAKHKKLRLDVESDAEEELQNMTVTSTDDRSSGTAAAAADQTEDKTVGEHQLDVITAGTQDEESSAITTAEQTTEDNIEDEAGVTGTKCSNVAVTDGESEMTEQVGDDSDGANDGEGKCCDTTIMNETETQPADEGIDDVCTRLP